jgi:hypothetical protein
MKRIKSENEPYIKMLLYGQPGSTKTRTAGSAALDERTSPTLMLDIGGNPISIRDYKQQPDLLRLENLADLNPVYDFLSRGQSPDHAIVKRFDLRPPYKTIIVDGVTDLQRYSFGMVTGNSKVGPGDIPAQTQIQHYGSVLAQMTTFARLFFALPMHVLITALEREDRDDGSGQIMYRPLLLGQSAAEVSAYAYVVARMVHRGRLEARTLREMGDTISANSVAVALFSPGGKYYAKDQTGRLGNYMVDPTMTAILDKVFPEVKK